MTSKYLWILIGFFATACYAVKITNLKVPPTYILEDAENPQMLLLDCEYDVSPHETGFVLKWLLNEQQIYQWIPSGGAHALSHMKNRIDPTYTVSTEKYYRHRALAITKPSWNITGVYTCSVQTFQSNDKKSAPLQVIVPESDFQLSHSIDNNDGIVNIKCTANDVFPQPKLSIFLGDDHKVDVNDRSKRGDDGLYDVIVNGKVNKDSITSPTAINCVLSITGTNYTKKREAVYYDQIITTTTEQNDDDDETSAISRLEAADMDGNSSHVVGVSKTMILAGLLLTMITWRKCWLN